MRRILCPGPEPPENQVLARLYRSIWQVFLLRNWLCSMYSRSDNQSSVKVCARVWSSVYTMCLMCVWVVCDRVCLSSIGVSFFLCIFIFVFLFSSVFYVHVFVLYTFFYIVYVGFFHVAFCMYSCVFCVRVCVCVCLYFICVWTQCAYLGCLYVVCVCVCHVYVC